MEGWFAERPSIWGIFHATQAGKEVGSVVF